MIDTVKSLRPATAPHRRRAAGLVEQYKVSAIG